LPVFRVFQLAKKLGLRSEALVAALEQMGVGGANPATNVDEETAQAVIELLSEQATRARQEAQAKQPPAPAAQPQAAVAEREAPEKEEWEEPEVVLGRRRPETVVGITELEQQIRELEAAEAASQAEEIAPLLAAEGRRQRGPRPETAIEAPAIVTVLGHVDHGKTTLLDSLRHTAVTESEHGGITQHIGASEIEHNGKRVVFIDTPGHEAFTAMRARGAQITDIAVLIVAADDGVMPQTIEAINHARAAEVPIIVAINKVDLPTADPQRVKQQLLEHNLVPEEWGGEQICVEISALTGQGLDELLENILVVAEVEELWADPEAEFVGVVIESGLDPAQGPLATVLVRSGSLKVGEVVVVGSAYGRVRRLRDWRGKSVKQMAAGEPVSIVGFSQAPPVGEIIHTAATPKEARQQAEAYQAQQRERELLGVAEVQLHELYRGLHLKESKSLNLVLKGDVAGTLQALESSLQQLSDRLAEVEINVVSTGIGGVTESDILLAVASQAIVIGYNVGTDEHVSRIAADDRVEIRFYNVIYKILEDIEKAAEGLLEPIYEEQFIGQAQVLQLFRVSRLGVIVGCRVLEGRMQRGARIEVKRQEKTVFEGQIDSLRHFQDEAATVEAPNECGLLVDDFRGWEEGDLIDAYAQVEVERRKATRQTEVSSTANSI